MRGETLKSWRESIDEGQLGRQSALEISRLIEERRRLLEFARFARQWMRCCCEEVPGGGAGHGGYTQHSDEEQAQALWESCDKTIAYAEAGEDAP